MAVTLAATKFLKIVVLKVWHPDHQHHLGSLEMQFFSLLLTTQKLLGWHPATGCLASSPGDFDER